MSDFSETETARDERQAGSRTSLAGVLSVDTAAVEAEHSTGHDASSPPGLRGHADLRSPGVKKTPLAVNERGNDHATGDHHFAPDFITQTDRYGRATTPRSAAVISHAGYGAPRQKEDAEMDAYDSFLDGFRSLCCCLVSDDDGSTTGVAEAGLDHTGGPVAYSTRGPDAPLLLEEDSALRNGANPQKIKLLGGLHNDDQGKKCLVLDLDETLVHSSFREVPGADFVIPVQIDDLVHYVYVAKRPNVDEFLMEMAKHYEIVIYTASLNKYADPLLDLLDPNRVIRTRLFRESCVFYAGNFVKDLSLLNRDLSQAIIVDNSPASYLFHPENAIDCTSFINDPNDQELNQIGKFLIGIKHVEDVRGVVVLWRQWPNIDLLKMKANKLTDQGNVDPRADVQ